MEKIEGAIHDLASTDPVSGAGIKSLVGEAREILERSPEGGLEIVTFTNETSDQELDEIAEFYHAVFGSKPWGVLLDDKGNCIPWEGVTEENIESLKEDPMYSVYAIKGTIKSWGKKEGSSIFYAKDAEGRVFSFGAIFKHENIDRLVEQIRSDNGYPIEDPLLDNLRTSFRESVEGDIIYIADLATHPNVRIDIDFTMNNWMNMFTRVIEFSLQDSLTLTLRTSSKEGAPLKAILDKMFSTPKPVFEEKDEILYYALKFNADTISVVKEQIKKKNFRRALASLMKAFR